MRFTVARFSRCREKELSELEQELDETIKGSPAWRYNGDLLQSAP